MIIDLTQSRLFIVEPDDRFAKEFGLPKGIWRELWKRYTLMGYNQPEMREYLLIKTGRKISEGSVCRWIIRTKIYSVSNGILKMGAKHVNSEVFGEYEDYVIKEMTKHLRSGASKNTKAII
ncbi:MAG: hypothetical protein EBR82_14455 [Caulobacteraceae bacterium]|nr:hypothetical protein [Caulobacteraceae bacterium]